MKRLAAGVRALRAIVGAALLAWAAVELARAAWEWLKREVDRPAVSRGVGAWGEVYELRVRPLDRAETRDAIERERVALVESWAALRAVPAGTGSSGPFHATTEPPATG